MLDTSRQITSLILIIDSFLLGHFKSHDCEHVCASKQMLKSRFCFLFCCLGTQSFLFELFFNYVWSSQNCQFNKSRLRKGQILTMLLIRIFQITAATSKLPRFNRQFSCTFQQIYRAKSKLFKKRALPMKRTQEFLKDRD